MAIVPIPGKVYLRDTRNGNVYEFERSLSEMSFVERVVLVPAEPEPEIPVEPEKPVEPEVPVEEGEQNPTIDEATTAEVKAAAPPPPPSGKKK